MDFEPDANIFDFYNRDEKNDYEMSQYHTQLSDDLASSRFFEPEIVIKEFSIEKLKAMKNKRFAKDVLAPVCPVCDKSFQRNSHLKRHLLIHTKEKPFKCDICGREFNQSSTMKSHKKSVHSNHKPFSCTEPNCTKTFSIISNLRMHAKSHLSIKELTCQHCTRSFKYQNSLKAHEKMHIFDLIDT